MYESQVLNAKLNFLVDHPFYTSAWWTILSSIFVVSWAKASVTVGSPLGEDTSFYQYLHLHGLQQIFAKSLRRRRANEILWIQIRKCVHGKNMRNIRPNSSAVGNNIADIHVTRSNYAIAHMR
jgi:hypothetical protein